MPVEYPVMIAAIKEWIGGHKTMPSGSVEIENQPAIKKASFSDMVTMAFTELVTLAATAGITFAVGGAEAFGKFFNGLNPALKAPLESLQGGFNSLTGSLPTSMQDALTWGKETFINPIGTTLSDIRLGLTEGTDKLNVLSSFTSDPAQAAAFTSAANSYSGAVGQAIQNMKTWTDGLTLGSGDYGFSLNDAFSAVNSSSTKTLELLGVTNAPTLTDFAGSLVKKDLTENMTASLTKEAAARAKMEAELKAPPPVGYVGSAGEYQATVSPATYAEWLSAHEDVVASAQAINQQVLDDQQNVVQYTAKQSALGAIGSASLNLNSLSDPDQKELYASTLNPTIKSHVETLAPVIGNVVTPSVPKDIGKINS